MVISSSTNHVLRSFLLALHPTWDFTLEHSVSSRSPFCSRCGIPNNSPRETPRVYYFGRGDSQRNKSGPLSRCACPHGWNPPHRDDPNKLAPFLGVARLQLTGPKAENSVTTVGGVDELFGSADCSGVCVNYVFKRGAPRGPALQPFPRRPIFLPLYRR